MDCVNCRFCGDKCIFEEEETCYGDLLDENVKLKAKVAAFNEERELRIAWNK